jgi:hypothetical protein
MSETKELSDTEINAKLAEWMGWKKQNIALLYEIEELFIKLLETENRTLLKRFIKLKKIAKERKLIQRLPDYLNNIADAFKVVEKFKKDGYFFRMDNAGNEYFNDNRFWRVSLNKIKEYPFFNENKSLSRAISLAALKVIDEIEKK